MDEDNNDDRDRDPDRTRDRDRDRERDTDQNKRLLEEVSAQIKAPGIKVEKGGQLQNVKIVNNEVDTPEGMSAQHIRNLKELSQEMPFATTKIDATIDAPNAEVSGRTTNVQITRNLFTICDSKKETNPQFTDSPLVSTPDYRHSGGAALRASERAQYSKQKSQPSTQNEMTFPLKKGKIKDSVSSTEHFVQTKKIETTATKVTQIKLPEALPQKMLPSSSKIDATIDASNAVISGKFISVNYTQMTPTSFDVIGIQNNYITPTPSAKLLPKLWKVPRQVTQPLQIFVGRTDEQLALNNLFEKTKTCCVLISAIGGQGKTVLAKKFIKDIIARDRSFPPAVNWINGETMQTLVNDISDYMKEIELPIVDTNNQSISTASMIDSLSRLAHQTTNGGWIVVIDNADKRYPGFVDIVGEFVRRGSFLIITSRQKNIILKDAEDIPLQGLEPDAASSLVKQLLPEKMNETDDNIFQLCKELQSYPLGIRQAIAYIKFQKRTCLGSKYGVNNFLDELRKVGTKVVFENKLRDYPDSICKIMEMILDKIKSEENGADAIKVLKVLSLVTADGVTIDYLGRLVKNCTKMENMKPPLILLKSICFVEEVSTSEEPSISVHRVVQTIVREKMKAEKEIEQFLDKLLGCHEYSLVRSHISSLDRNQILHLMQIWEHSFEYSNLVKGHSDMATDIFNKLLKLTLYQELLRFTESIASALRHISGGEDQHTLWMEYWHCLGLETSGEYEKALKQYHIVWQKQVKYVGPYHPHTLLTQEQIASTFCRMKKWEESLKKHQEVYSLMLKHLPKNHSHTRITQHNIAICLKEKGELDEALPIFQDVYDFRRKKYGDTASWTLDTRSHIADIWFQKRDFEKARLEYEEVYMVSKGKEGELHENTIRAMEMSAKSLWELGRKQEGYGKLSEVAGLYEKARGSKHPTTLMIQDLLRKWNSQINL
ncbi:unnamed protein product [Sphagnum jensenii]|uniref:NB-ARC domain-containing protein n=1 Tax=Sphagnum jensenii TaxID=128206 RepID=A0ABP0V7Q5_9BRYO